MDWSTFSIGNAAGFIKGPGKQFDDMLRSAATEITIGSITLLPRDGNLGDVYVALPDGTSVNSLGLPNPGLDHTLRVASDMSRRAEQAGKELRWSIAGFTYEEYGDLAAGLSPFGKIELNLGCPNVWAAGGQKDIVSFNLKMMEDTFNRVGDLIQTRFDVKLSPYSNPLELGQTAQLIKKEYPIIARVIVSNTFPNGYGGRDMPNGLGGIGGNAMHIIALGQVAQFVHLFQDGGPEVVGVGGINSGARILAMEAIGAAGVQIGTAFGELGARIFSDSTAEAMEITA